MTLLKIIILGALILLCLALWVPYALAHAAAVGAEKL